MRGSVGSTKQKGILEPQIDQGYSSSMQVELGRIKIVVAYDGSHFGGWQRQPQGLPTIQGELQDCLSQIFNESIRVIGAGRTDAGVHALAQVAHFDAPKTFDSNSLFTALNKMTPKTISIKGLWSCPSDFHALSSAVAKHYRYVIWNHQAPNPFLSRYTTWIWNPLDLEKLNKCAELFVGQHDFKSFQNTGTDVPSTVRRIFKAQWKRKGDRVIFDVVGEGFLKQMVRNMVGLQLEIVRSSRSPLEIKEVLEAKQRSAAGATAPPEGLFLKKVFYPRDLDNQCRKV